MQKTLTGIVLVGLMCVAGPSTGQSALSLATFRSDVTPPMGHLMNGVYSDPVKSVEDRTESQRIAPAGRQGPLCAMCRGLVRAE